MLLGDKNHLPNTEVITGASGRGELLRFGEVTRERKPGA